MYKKTQSQLLKIKLLRLGKLLAVTGAFGISMVAQGAPVAYWRMQDFKSNLELIGDDVKFKNDVNPEAMPLCSTGKIKLQVSNDLPGTEISSGVAGQKASLNQRSLQVPGANLEPALKADVGRNLRLEGFTVEMFIKVEKALPWGTVICLPRSGGVSDWVTWSWQITLENKLTARFDSNNAGETLGFNQRMDTPFEIVDGKWHHVAMTFSKTTAKFYIDHELVAAKADFHNLPLKFDDSAEFVFGKGVTCSVTDIRISDLVLTPEQFLKVEKAAAAGKKAGE
jgi:hypothetical protein